MDIETFVQRHYLQQILLAANYRFAEMSAGQFELRLMPVEDAGQGKNRGLGSLAGSSETYWGQNKGRSMEGGLVKITKILAAAFFVLSLILSMGFLK